MANSIDAVVRQFAAMGMPPLPDGGLQLDAGRVVRFGPAKKAWYRVFAYTARNNKTYLSGAFGYKGAGPYKIESDWSDLDAAEREQFAREQAAAVARAEAKRVQRAEAAAKRAASQWRMAKKVGESGYLVRKQVRGESCRYADGVLLVPALRYDHAPAQLVGLQKIFDDGQKRFSAGMAKEGAACRLGDAPKDGDTLYLCEGYATGGSVRAALEYKGAVFVAFDAGNLVPVARILRAQYPASTLVVCADNDHATDGNPGLTKANEAAKVFGNARVVMPVFAGDATGLTDFNDLAVAEGVSVVAAQLAVDSDDSPASPSEGEAGAVMLPNMATLLAHFSLIYGKTDVWDNLQRMVIKRAGFVAAYGKPLVDAWFAHPERRTISPESLPRLKRGRSTEGGAGDRFAHMVRRYTLLYGTTTVWDGDACKVLTLASLVAAFGNDDVNRWQESTARRIIDADNLVFDPTQRCDPETHINMFDGFPLQPAGTTDQCAAILDLLADLCSHEPDSAAVYAWLLKWIAYPLQHPGAKMQSAVLMFGEKQGTGKSLFWEGVVKALYGEYGTTAGQHQLDSQFTEWRSRKVFVVFEEVLSRSERYNFIGTIKHMITGRTQRINPKGLPEREEANHLNSVFLSNEPQPIPLELEDRRFMVVEARNKLSAEQKSAVLNEIAHGGLAAFYHYLLQFDLGDFEPGSLVLHTLAREKIINFGLPSHEAFYREWRDGELEVPYCSCRVADLFEMYRRWCNRTGERLLTQTKFSELIGNRVHKTRGYVWGGSGRVQARIFQLIPNENSIVYGLPVDEQCAKFRAIADIKD
jgi:putative DNA primase/helicase